MCNFQLPIGGFIKQSLIDYPGHIASVVFVKGCNMRCFYCHNPELVIPNLIERQAVIPVNSVIEWIAKNTDLLDAVVITGGEPTLHPSLPDFLRLLKNLSLKIKLDTNGTNSRMLALLIEKQLLDYVAMDIKAPLKIEKYQSICGSIFSEKLLAEIEKSMEILMQSMVAYEFRTTLNAALSADDVLAILSHIKGSYYLQLPNKENHKVIDPDRMDKYDIDINSLLEYGKCLEDVNVNVR